MAMADGISDEREQVRKAASDALISAVLDRHSSAVPPGVLIDVLGDIVMPVVSYVGQHILDRPSPSLHCPAVSEPIVAPAGHQHASPHLQRNWMRVEMKDSAVQEKEIPDTDSDPQLLGDSNAEPQRSATSTDPELEMFRKCLSGLSLSLVRHLKRLSSFPSFDKLWLRFLELLVYFTHCSENAGTGTVSEGQTCVKELEDISVEKVRELLRALTDERIFLHKEGLRTVTVDMLRGVDRCRSVIEELSI